MNYLTCISLKNVKRHPVQSMLTILGISLSVALILASFMVNLSMKRSALKTAEELGTGKTGVWIQELTEDVATVGSKQEGFPEELLNIVLKNKNVSSVHPSVKIYTSMPSRDKIEENNFYLYGINFSDDQMIRNYVITKGKYPRNENEVLIGENFANTLKLKIGSEVSMPSPKGKLNFVISGLLSSSKGTGTLNNNLVIFADLKTIQNYFGYENTITSINIVLNSGVKPREVVNQFKALLPSNVNAFTDPIFDIANSTSSDKLKMMTFVFAFISVFIAVFVIYNTLSSSVEQSRKEIGLLRLIGMTNKQIKSYFLIQSLIYASVGSIIGIFLGILLGAGLLYLVNLVFKFQTFFIELPSVFYILISVAIGVVVTVIVGLFPAIKASKVSPLEVFRTYEVEENNEKYLRLKNIFGILLIILGVVISYSPANTKLSVYLRFLGPASVFIGICNMLDLILPIILKGMSKLFSAVFGLPGLLAVQSLQLRLKRTVITIGSITVAVAIFIGLFGSFNSMKRTVTEWYDTTKWADILVFSVSGAEIDESILNKIESYNFIEKINPLRYHFIPYLQEDLSDNGFLYQGVDPEKFKNFTGLQVIEGNTNEVIKEMQNNPSILVNENLLKMLHLKIGDTIKLNTTNNGLVDFKVEGSIADYSDFTHRLGKVVYGSQANLEKFWGAKGYTVIQIKLNKGFNIATAKEQLVKDLSGKYNIKVITHDEEKKDVSASSDQIFSILYAFNIIIFIIVFMGIFNTVLINVLFQIREFAVLRTLGFFSKQIRKLVICEALAMGIIGSLFGIIVGLWFSKQMTIGAEGIMGTILTFYMPISMSVLLFFVTLIISVIATLYPQKLATGISISKVMQSIDEI